MKELIITNNSGEQIKKTFDGERFALVREWGSGFNTELPIAIILNPEEARRDALWTLEILRRQNETVCV